MKKLKYTLKLIVPWELYTCMLWIPAQPSKKKTCLLNSQYSNQLGLTFYTSSFIKFTCL